MKRLQLVALIAIVVVVGIVIWLALRSRAPSVAQGEAAPPVALATVREGSVREIVQATGRVGMAAGTQAKLSFAVPGTVARVNVRLGERVAAGETLAQLDPVSYSLSAAQANAEARAAGAQAQGAAVDRVTAKLHYDETELARQERLFRAGIVALRDVQSARETLAADRAEAQGAQAATQAAQEQQSAANLRASGAAYDAARTVLRSPASGTVVGIFVTPGENVDASTGAIAIAPDGDASATLDVPVAQIGRVKTGDAVRLQSGAATWNARVAGVATAADPATGLALVSVTGLPSGTPAGTPLDATIVVGYARGLVVPRDAIVDDPQTGAQLVFVREPRAGGGYTFTARTVTTGGSDDRSVRVFSGLHPGESVAAQGAIDLLARPGGGD